MAIEHWVTLVPDTKALEKGIKAAFDGAKKDATVEVKVDKGAAGKSGEDAGKAIDKGAKDATQNTGKDVGAKIDKDVRSATKDTGKDAGARVGSTLGTAIGGALGSIIKDKVGKTLDKVISGDVQGAARDVGAAFDFASGALDRLQNAAGSESFVGRGIGKLKGVVDGARSSIDTLAGTFSAVSSGTQMAQSAFQGFSSVVRLATGSQIGLNLAMLANPVGLIVAGIAAVVAGLVLFFTKTEVGRKIWEKFTQVAGKAWDWVKEKASAAWKWFESTLWPGIKTGVETAAKVFVSLRDTIGKVFSKIKEYIQPVLDMITKIKDVVGGVVSGVGGFVGRLFGSSDAPDPKESADPSKPKFEHNDPISFPDALGGRLRGALSDAKQNEKDRREAEREARQSQREEDRAKREADRAEDRARRESERADRAEERAQRGSASAGGGTGGRSTTGSVGTTRGFGGNLAAMMALAQAASGRTKYGPASDLAGGLADCSGAISDLVEVLDTGKSSPKRLFTTVDFATDEQAAKFGFLPGYMPGALNIGVTPLPGQSGHMAATLPNGVNFESGGGTGGGAQYGGNAAGALDKQFTKRYYRPVDGSGASSFGGGGSVNPSSMPGFYAWVVPMSGDGAAAAGGPMGGGGGGMSFGGGAGGGNSVLSQLRNIGEGGAKESFLPAGFSDPTSWPNVKSGMALLNVFGGMLGSGGQQGLIGDTRNLAPGELNPAITAGGSASLLGGAAGMMTNLTQGGGVAHQQAGGQTGGVDNSVNINAPVNGNVESVVSRAHQTQTANARTLRTSGPRAI